MRKYKIKVCEELEGEADDSKGWRGGVSQRDKREDKEREGY